MSQAIRATSVVVLPEPGGRDAQHGPGRRGGGRALVRGQARETFRDLEASIGIARQRWPARAHPAINGARAHR